MKTYQSWGRYPRTTPRSTHAVRWRHESIPFETWDRPVLPYACGRSYGDSCLNDGGVILDIRGLNRFISFDIEQGLLRCESGVTLANILEVIVPKGWFLPVTPGTKFVSLGGAVANDVHGKNHHRAGTLGCHVQAFELLRSNGERLICSGFQNQDLFHATIGGLGLTGVILWVEIQLKPITGPWMDIEQIRFSSLDEFFTLSSMSDKDFEYTLAWVDCLSGGRNLGRGSFMRGNHHIGPHPDGLRFQPKAPFKIPCNMPNWLLNPQLMSAFNSLYFYSRPVHQEATVEPYDSFFYPLDWLLDWNRLYGARGFLQYQCVIPTRHEQSGMRELLGRIQRNKLGSFLAVLKQFGASQSPGIMSFPKQGTTLSLDFPYHGEKTLKLLNDLDEIVTETGGAVYPAKDACMNFAHFQTYFPKWREFTQYVDPKFSSSFWRRVMTPRSHQATPSQTDTLQTTNHGVPAEMAQKVGAP